MRNNKLTPAHSFKRDLKKQSFELFLTPEWAEVIDCLNNGKKMSKERLDHDLQSIQTKSRQGGEAADSMNNTARRTNAVWFWYESTIKAKIVRFSAN